MGVESSKSTNQHNETLLPLYVAADVDNLLWYLLPQIVTALKNLNSFGCNYRCLERCFTGKGKRWFFFAVIVYFCARQFYEYYKKRCIADDPPTTSHR